MSLGTLYVLPGSPRSFIIMDLIKYFKIDIEIKDDLECPAFQAKFPSHKTPAFVGPKGFKLHETLAILNYVLSFVPKDELKGFLGKNNEQYASILKYLSFFNTEFISSFIKALFMVIGKAPYNKKLYDEKIEELDLYGQMLESRLSEFTYLVGERITLADIASASCFSKAYGSVLGKPYGQKYPNVIRWFNTVKSHPIFAGRFDDFVAPEQPLTFVPPKKEKKEQKPKEEKPKKAAKEVEEEEEKPVEEPKPKHPLDLLPRISLEEWKRVYSNEDTRAKAIPWFWENQYKPEEFSLWKVDYKYNDELTLTFMSNNLVGGFFNRLSASTKYLFGTLVVYGENNNNGITGFFLVRGQDYAPAFDVAPDWESYSYTKLDGNDAETRKFIDNMLAWDEPVEVNGEKREIADGKVFK
ncbi:uncharacterized protein RJT21DRAFT_140297 [Scheffersomyces amazonensis]|uniref:uncharacterized protein n=1 Tax=Scheffersomyces amazonensis TaxID=1078765 RepID=UPI00315D6582